MATKDLGIILKWMQSGQGNLKQAENQVASMERSVKKLALALGAYGLGRATASFLKDSYLMAGQAERLGKATANLAANIGASGDAMVKSIKEASNGTISSVRAMTVVRIFPLVTI